MKRTRLRPISAKRRAVNQQRREVLEAHFGPRPWTCHGQRFKAHICRGPVNGHEILKRSRSGRDENLLDVSGIVPVCDGFNGWIENNPIGAHDLGLAKHSWEA